MLPRDISKNIIESSKQYDVLTILGPRQSGKTTLVKNLFSDPNFNIVQYYTFASLSIQKTNNGLI